MYQGNLHKSNVCRFLKYGINTDSFEDQGYLVSVFYISLENILYTYLSRLVTFNMTNLEF